MLPVMQFSVRTRMHGFAKRMFYRIHACRMMYIYVRKIAKMYIIDNVMTYQLQNVNSCL